MDLPRSWDELWEMRDKRTDGWFLVDSPAANVAICLAYVVLVTKLGPLYMKDRPAYRLKHLLMAYNLGQVVFSSVMVYRVSRAAWFNHYSWACQPVEQGTDPGSSAMIIAACTWGYFVNKYVELLDTFFFIARKKFGQVSALHVYHHAVMPLYTYAQIRWLPGGHETLPGLVNLFVHIFMYAYYFLAAFGPRMQPYLWWKRYLTMLQLAQFVFAFLHSLVLVLGIVSCDYPWQVSLLSMAILHVPFFLMFLKFYLGSYVKKPIASDEKKGD